MTVARDPDEIIADLRLRRFDVVRNQMVEGRKLGGGDFSFECRYNG